MKKVICIVILSGAVSIIATAQTAVNRIYIKGGKDAWENYQKEVYLNPSFEDGIVEYKNGKRYKSKLNYNRAIGSIQFISENGDTLALNDETSISLVTIGKQQFFMDPLCLLQVVENDKAVLAKNEKIRVADKQKVGAMGIPHSEGTIDSYDRSYSRNNHYIDINEQLLIRKTASYYIETADQKFMPASKKNILSMFPGSQGAIKKFIEEKAIDFDNEEDLVKLTTFLGTI